MTTVRKVYTSLFLIVCTLFFFGESCDSQKPTSAQQEAAMNEENQQRMIKAVPVPKLETSLERKNLARRLELINKDNRTGYVYLISYGKIIAEYHVSGKVTSLNSYMTAMEQIVTVGDGNTNAPKEHVTMEAPDQDGSYGKNADGVFFFTTDGSYVEWKGDYLWSDVQLKLLTAPELAPLKQGVSVEN